jgi:hypothetical protein
LRHPHAPGSDMKRILERSLVDEDTGCWNWTGPTKGFGYGFLTSGSRSDGTRKTESTHRYSFRMAKGDIPEGACVLHRCDNPKCVNPDHLYIGDRKRNVRDMIERGRRASSKGEMNNNSVLTEHDISMIRSERAINHTPYRKLAKKYGVKSHKTIMQICSGELWGHVDSPEPPK